MIVVTLISRVSTITTLLYETKKQANAIFTNIFCFDLTSNNVELVYELTLALIWIMELQPKYSRGSFF